MSLVTFPQVTVVGARSRELESHLVAAGMRVSHAATSDLPALAHPTARPGQVLMIDLRDSAALPAAVGALRRNHADTAVVLVVSTLDPALMLDAMRAGVTELVAEPLTQAALEAAVSRVWQTTTSEDTGQVFAVLGVKGGVGATTVAVNMSYVLAREAPGEALLMDMHLAQGDAAVLMSAEPRFSVVDALENTHRLDEAFFRGLVVDSPKGAHLLASSDRHVIGAPAADRIRALIDFASRTYRYVVLDVPRTDLTVLDGLESSHRIVMVLNQELSAIRNAARFVDTLGQRYGKDRIVLALARFDKGAEISPADIQKVVGLPVTFSIPNDYRTAVRAANQGTPLVLGSGHAVAAALRSMTRELAGLRTAAPAPQQNGGLFGRLSLRRPSQAV
jgi:pilus assembly protein CpaE